MNWRIVVMVLAALNVVTVLSFPSASSSVSFEVYVSPEYSDVAVGEEFSVSIDVTGVPYPGIFSYQLILNFNPAYLIAADAEIPDGHFLTPTSGVPPSIFIVQPGIIDNTAGTVSFAVALLAPEEGKTGSGVLATVTFRGKAEGATLLTLEEVILADPEALEISENQYVLKNGSVNVRSGSSVSFEVYVSPEYSDVAVGEEFSVSIDVTGVPYPGIFAYELTLEFNLAYLEAISADAEPEGHFLTPTSGVPPGIFTVDPGTIDNEAGTVEFAVTLLAPEEGKTGSGVLATVTFRGKAPGTTLLSLEDVLLADPNATLITESEYVLKNGSIDIQLQLEPFPLWIIVGIALNVGWLLVCLVDQQS